MTPRPAFAIVRLEDASQDGEPRVVVERVVWTRDVAMRVVEQLNGRATDCRYLWRPTRIDASAR